MRTDVLAHVRELAGFHRLLEDLQARAKRMPGYGLSVIERDISRLKRDIAELESALSARQASA
jgi:hypothetical protein